MRHFLLLCILALTAMVLVSAPQVRADGTDTFTYTTTSATYVWQLRATPTPDVVSPGLFFGVTNVAVSMFEGGVFQSTSTDALLFFAGGFGVSFENTTPDLSTLNFAFASPDPTTNSIQLFSGVPGGSPSPTFNLGTYNGVTQDGSSATLVIATPEPSSWVMLFAGFLALAGFLAVRKVQA